LQRGKYHPEPGWSVDSQPPLLRSLRSADEISSARLKGLFHYWAALKGERLGPSRADLNPAEMREQLGWIWLMDVLDGGDDFRFRMGGDRVVQFFGERLSGNTLKAVLPRAPAFFGRFLDLATRLVETGAPVIGGPSQTSYQPKSYLEIEAVLFPLSDDGVSVTGLMGSIEIKPLKSLDTRD
jgi:hypothetical protein